MYKLVKTSYLLQSMSLNFFSNISRDKLFTSLNDLRFIELSKLFNLFHPAVWTDFSLSKKCVKSDGKMMQQK